MRGDVVELSNNEQAERIRKINCKPLTYVSNGIILGEIVRVLS